MIHFTTLFVQKKQYSSISATLNQTQPFAFAIQNKGIVVVIPESEWNEQISFFVWNNHKSDNLRSLAT